MFIIYSTETESTKLGIINESSNCEKCNNIINYDLVEYKYTYRLFYLIPFLVIRTYFLVCPICNKKIYIKKNKALEYLDSINRENNSLIIDSNKTNDEVKDNNELSIGEHIFQIRRKSGLSQEEFGYKFNVSRQTVSKWELNVNKPEEKKYEDILVYEKELNKELLINSGVIKEKNNNIDINLIFTIIFYVGALILLPLMIVNNIITNVPTDLFFLSFFYVGLGLGIISLILSIFKKRKLWIILSSILVVINSGYFTYAQIRHNIIFNKPVIDESFKKWEDVVENQHIVLNLNEEKYYGESYDFKDNNRITLNFDSSFKYDAGIRLLDLYNINPRDIDIEFIYVKDNMVIRDQPYHFLYLPDAVNLILFDEVNIYDRIEISFVTTGYYSIKVEAYASLRG